MQERARAIIAQYPSRRSAVMPLLYLAMSVDGYLTEEGMAEVAEWIGITPAQVLSVASFYTMYKLEPAGRYLISCCTSISCMLLDADDVLHALEDEAGVASGQVDQEGLIASRTRRVPRRLWRGAGCAGELRIDRGCHSRQSPPARAVAAQGSA